MYAFTSVAVADGGRGYGKKPKVQLGPRPFYLVDKMDQSGLKKKLQQCMDRRNHYKKNDFSIGHRGAPLQFPEHTKESYVAAARMGAGILECDVTFTSDGELVCRHAQCDLQTTTNIVATDLAEKCTVPPIIVDGELTNAADIKCCASDLTLAEFKSLCGKMDAANTNATTIEAYMDATANWRTDLYSTCGTLLSHEESIELFDRLGVGMTPELKAGDPDNIKEVFGSQANYAQKMIDEYKDAQIKPRKVWAQSFNPADVLYWIENEPSFGKQAVFLDGRYSMVDPADPDDPGDPKDPANPTLKQIADQGVNIIAPPMWMLLTVESGRMVPSKYARKARRAGLDIITWTTERSGRIVEDVLDGGGTFYYQSTLDAISNDGDILTTIHVLAQEVGVIGIFSDWPATTTFYANCLGPKMYDDDD
jgi:glycerophosphoryl diester phosphodiesterase